MDSVSADRLTRSSHVVYGADRNACAIRAGQAAHCVRREPRSGRHDELRRHDRLSALLLWAERAYNVYALGSQSATAFYETYPIYKTSDGPFITIFPNQQSGTANSGTAVLKLEVANNHIGPEGLDVKAVWPVRTSSGSST